MFISLLKYFFFSTFVFYGVEKRKRIHLKYYVLK